MSDPRVCVTPRTDANLPGVSYLLFRDGAGDLRSVPLADIERIELVAAGEVEMIAGHPAICSHGHCVPLVSVTGEPVPSQLPVLIFRRQGREVGLLVRKAADIVHGEKSLTAMRVRAFDVTPYLNHALAMMPEISRCPHSRGASLKGWSANMLAAARQFFYPPRVHAGH